MTETGGRTVTFDTEALRRGVEDRDLDSMLSLYDEDAEVRMVDQRNTPSRPAVLHGRAEIREFLSDVIGRDMTHKMDHVVVGDGTVSYLERCVYPDGTRVVASSVLDVDDGHIVRQEGVQAWDRADPVPEYHDFARPDEVRTFEKGRLELISTPSGDVGRMLLEPGWRWSEHVKPIAGTDLCETAHFGYQITGTLQIRMADGTELIATPGQVGSVPPGHDAWVVGNEPAVLLDWLGASGYAR